MNFTGFCGKPPFFRPRGTAGKAQNGKPRQSQDCRSGVFTGPRKSGAGCRGTAGAGFYRAAQERSRLSRESKGCAPFFRMAGRTARERLTRKG